MYIRAKQDVQIVKVYVDISMIIKILYKIKYKKNCIIHNIEINSVLDLHQKIKKVKFNCPVKIKI